MFDYLSARMKPARERFCRIADRSAFVAFVVLVALVFMLSVLALKISSIVWEFSYLTIGRLVGPILGLVISALILIVLMVAPALIVDRFLTSKTNGTLKDLWAFLKMRKKKAMRVVLLGLALFLVVMSLFSLFFLPKLLQAGQKINSFVIESRGLSLQEYVANLTLFLNNNLRSSYNKPENLFKVDEQISYTILDPYILKLAGVTRADLIVYQGWGACGQAAILIEELLHDSGYETRDAHFKGVDHQWAEVKNNGKWSIVDPWYIGNLVEIQQLKNLKPDFQHASGVEVEYPNGTRVDSSREHGY